MVAEQNSNEASVSWPIAHSFAAWKRFQTSQWVHHNVRAASSALAKTLSWYQSGVGTFKHFEASQSVAEVSRAHGVPLGEVADDRTGDVSDEALHFDDLDVALRFCEISFLKVGLDIPCQIHTRPPHVVGQLFF